MSPIRWSVRSCIDRKKNSTGEKHLPRMAGSQHQHSGMKHRLPFLFALAACSAMTHAAPNTIDTSSFAKNETEVSCDKPLLMGLKTHTLRY